TSCVFSHAIFMPLPSPVTPTPTPGFELLFAIFGVAAAVCLVRRRGQV
ncbi:MAG: PGF-CTERM sorting domain-containing protein, partial [Proteobacteria bacterium]|nr:PGF-CTERM sorting domain-containing protein [Pseudomonadota bacterium]